MTRTILILGTNAGQADLIRHMKDIGWRVIGCAPGKGEPGQAFCDVVEHVDIVDLDALEAVARRHAVNLVYSISSDVAIRSVVALSERLGLPHFYDSAFIGLLDDKAALRAFLAEHGLSPVPFRKVSDTEGLSDWTHFPCMVKPTDAQGQRGVQRIDRPEDLAQAVERAIPLSRSRQAIVEGFLDGIEVSCNVLVCGGQTRIRVLSERLVHGPSAPGVPRGHLIPAVHVPMPAREEALELVDAIIAALGHRDGVLYFQMIMTPEGPRVVEIAPRLDGCHMWRLIRASHDIDLLARAVDCLTGIPVPTAETPPTGGDRPMELMFQQMPPGQPFDPAAFPVPADALYHEYRYAAGEDVRAVNGTLEVVGYYVRAMS
ncbi:ATP-grasp domain-containing protein [Paracoccus denitrificans]|jgi:phosphoribosylamine-glycine ligase|uniref:ATP-dependent carboxylate-amine ligase domain protein, ATP-grasp n=2 Tax=Paracoccus denitrificans TaxID=266 RepID=A1B7X8_PARDP|nr:ATP-grasp domain-containing protein [Paracoccus denitrificans]ABL71622.1 ATP-dependent carboxylate-amine ligase domain protein, ATP-grasp [Paracoccus denitrificans PD1222]MBB4630272.1 phosphoribosylamine-glycine ligase [Paracoccus denitrificans]MCU7431636.1 ATP-grasp domain-containing protein [Paracoccus denitrificans]QAR28215.1 ATP-grasp domain-containing protein [Paracoccus denitrificans]UPV97951.1 ATP-grasp domain-containing protein [Paracoccus denitrificans]